MLLDIALPEGVSYPAVLKGSYWVATDTEFFIAAWNSSRLKKEDEPKTFEDFADPKWAKRLIAEPRDFQLLLGLAKYKYGSDEKAVALFKKIAANKPEFFKGHSQLAELLAAGQADVCMTCYAHHIPPMAKKGAPLQIMLDEGVGRIGGTVTIVRGAPHPNAGLLWARWLISEEGQRAFAQAGETPAHPKVEPMRKLRPKLICLLPTTPRSFPSIKNSGTRSSSYAESRRKAKQACESPYLLDHRPKHLCASSPLDRSHEFDYKPELWLTIY